MKIKITVASIMIVILIISLVLYKDTQAKISQQKPIGDIKSNAQSFIKLNQPLNANKIRQNAVIIEENVYSKCGHTVVEKYDIEKNDIELTQEEFQKKHKDVIVRIFSPDEIVITKKVIGFCPNHYYITNRDGKIAVFNQISDEMFNLQEVTNIYLDSLRKEDKAKIYNGIKVDSKDKLGNLLEDLGS